MDSNNQTEEAEGYDEIEFSINPDGIIRTMLPNPTDKYHYELAQRYYSYFRTSDEWGSSVYEDTTYTIFEDLSLSPIEVLPPVGINWEDMTLRYERLFNENEDQLEQTSIPTKFAISGNRVYIILNPRHPAILKGNIEKNRIVIPDQQVVGVPYKIVNPVFAGDSSMFEHPRYADFVTVETEVVKSKYYGYEIQTTPLNCPLSFNYDPATGLIGDADCSFKLKSFYSHYGSDIYVNPKYNDYADIKVTESDELDNEPYFNLYGVKYKTRPSTPGLYIHKGKKILVK